MRNDRNEWQLKYQKSEQTIKELTSKFQNERTEWRQKLENREQIINKLKENNNYLEKEFKEISDFLMTTTKELMPLSQIIDYMLFGTFRSGAHSLHVFCDGLKVTFVSVNDSEVKLKRNIMIPFMQIKEFMFCSESSFPVLIIKTTPNQCHQIQNCLRLGTNSPNDYKFDVNSNGIELNLILFILNLFCF